MEAWVLMISLVGVVDRATPAVYATQALCETQLPVMRATSRRARYWCERSTNPPTKEPRP